MREHANVVPPISLSTHVASGHHDRQIGLYHEEQEEVIPKRMIIKDRRKQVIVPSGMTGGQFLQVETLRRLMEVTIPAGLKEGEPFEIEVPASKHVCVERSLHEGKNEHGGKWPHCALLRLAASCPFERLLWRCVCRCCNSWESHDSARFERGTRCQD